MTLKELSQLYYINKEIESDMQRLEELRLAVSSPSSSKISGMPFSGSRINITENILAEIIELESIINNKINRCVAERARLERYICGISDSLTRQIFTLRFIKCFSWRQVAYKLGGGNTADGVRMLCKRYIAKENEKK